MTWEQLASHYNICVAKALEELGKLGPNEYDYLDTIKDEVYNRLDNPRFTLNLTSDFIRTPCTCTAELNPNPDCETHGIKIERKN